MQKLTTFEIGIINAPNHPRGFTAHRLDLLADNEAIEAYEVEASTIFEARMKAAELYQAETRAAVDLAKFLKERGIAEDKLSSRGVADDQPLAPNDNEQNRRQNRRVEIVIRPNG